MMFPSTISRISPVPGDPRQWAEEVVMKTMSLPSWVAFKRTEIGCEAAERMTVARLISQRLGKSESSKREDYDISDTRLLEVAKSVVSHMRWHEDAQCAMRKIEQSDFDYSQGDYAAIYMLRVLGYGDDPVDLRRTMASQYSVPPQRIVLAYLGSEE